VSNDKDQKIVAISCTKSEQDAIIKFFRYSPIALKLAEHDIYPSNSDFLKLGLMCMSNVDKETVLKYIDNLTDFTRFMQENVK